MSERVAPRAEDQTYTRHVVMFEAVCTCGWKQLHSLASNALLDAQEQANGRHRFDSEEIESA